MQRENLFMVNIEKDDAQIDREELILRRENALIKADREALAEQYVKAWRTDEVFARNDALREKMNAYAATLEGEPHPVIKAKCFAFCACGNFGV